MQKDSEPAFLEMMEVEIYTGLRPEQLAEVYTSDSPVQIRRDEEGSIHYDLRDVRWTIGGGMIENAGDYKEVIGIYQNIEDALQAEFKSIMWTDELVNETDRFIAVFKYALDYLRHKSIDFVVVANNEENNREIIGHYRSGKVTLNPEFNHDLKRLMG